MPLRDRLSTLYSLRSEQLPTLIANARDSSKDGDGSSSAILARAMRFAGVARFTLLDDVSGFQESLKSSAEIRMRFLQRREQGEPIDESYVSIIVYKDVLDALAADKYDLAQRLADLMGGRTEIEQKHDHEFDRCFGYTLRSLVLADTDTCSNCLVRLNRVCSEHRNRNFLGYEMAFRSIFERNQPGIDMAMSAIVEGHIRESKGNGVFVNTEDELLCIWGLGIVRLASHVGLVASPIDPLIPARLV